jgi:hypothetical protein
MNALAASRALGNSRDSSFFRLAYAGGKNQLSEQLARCSGQLVPVSFAREKMAINVKRHGYGGIPKQVLHLFGRQLATSARLRIDAPAGDEMPKGVQGVFGFHNGLAVLVLPLGAPLSFRGTTTPAAAMIGSGPRSIFA